MESRLKALYREIDTLLNLTPCMDDCTEEENEVYFDMANLKNSLSNAGYDRDENRSGVQMKKFKDMEPGELVFCIEEDSYAGLLFMAVCNQYVLVCPEDWGSEGNFDAQLEMMCDENRASMSSGIYIFPANEVFLTEEDAERYLHAGNKE